MPNIIFVCTANIIRSPVASALFSQKLAQAGLSQSWHVASAGTWARDGYPAARETQELMTALRLDLSRHRSRMLTEKLLKSADLVLVMEHGHKEALQAEFPACQPRIYLLSEMVGRHNSIRDPLGGSKEDFKEMIREIDQLLTQGFEKILALADGKTT